MTLIFGILLSALFIKQDIANLGKQERSLGYVGRRNDTSPHCFIVSNREVCTMLLLDRVSGAFLACQKSILLNNMCVFLRNGPNRCECPRNLGHLRIHTRTPRTRRWTIHPCTPTTTLSHKTTNHVSSEDIWMRSGDSLSINKGMGDSSWSSLVLETLESDVPSGTSAVVPLPRIMAKQQCSSTCLRPSSEEIQLHFMSVLLKGV